MLLVAGVNLRNLVPRFWDPEDKHHIPGIRALMISYADFAGKTSRLEKTRTPGLREWLRIPRECQIFLDNGAFHSLKNDEVLDVRGYTKFVARTRPDWYPIPVEH